MVCAWTLELPRSLVGVSGIGTLDTRSGSYLRAEFSGHNSASLADHNLLIRGFWTQLVDLSARPADGD